MYSIDTKQKSLMMLMFVACGMIILIHVHQWARNNTFWGPSHLSKCCPVFLKQVADDNDMSILMLRYQATNVNNKISNTGAIAPFSTILKAKGIELFYLVHMGSDSLKAHTKFN